MSTTGAVVHAASIVVAVEAIVRVTAVGLPAFSRHHRQRVAVIYLAGKCTCSNQYLPCTRNKLITNIIYAIFFFFFNISALRKVVKPLRSMGLVSMKYMSKRRKIKERERKNRVEDKIKIDISFKC